MTQRIRGQSTNPDKWLGDRMKKGDAEARPHLIMRERFTMCGAGCRRGSLFVDHADREMMVGTLAACNG